MNIFTIGDLHLSIKGNKSMDIFGDNWVGHDKKIKNNWERIVKEDDVVVVLGDSSWAMDLEEAYHDFEYIHHLPGKKLIIKGNHDYWWNTVLKMRHYMEKNGFDSIDFIHNNTYVFNGIALCGTRGWFIDENPEHDVKVFKREILRLETSLKLAKAQNPEEICVFLHYPPAYQGYACEQIMDLLCDYGVKRCFYGHLHGIAHARSIRKPYRDVNFYLVSSDCINFTPFLVAKGP